MKINNTIIQMIVFLIGLGAGHLIGFDTNSMLYGGLIGVALCDVKDYWRM